MATGARAVGAAACANATWRRPCPTALRAARATSRPRRPRAARDAPGGEAADVDGRSERRAGSDGPDGGRRCPRPRPRRRPRRGRRPGRARAAAAAGAAPAHGQRRQQRRAVSAGPTRRERPARPSRPRHRVRRAPAAGAAPSRSRTPVASSASTSHQQPSSAERRARSQDPGAWPASAGQAGGQARPRPSSGAPAGADAARRRGRAAAPGPAARPRATRTARPARPPAASDDRQGQRGGGQPQRGEQQHGAAAAAPADGHRGHGRGAAARRRAPAQAQDGGDHARGARRRGAGSARAAPASRARLRHRARGSAATASQRAPGDRPRLVAGDRRGRGQRRRAAVRRPRPLGRVGAHRGVDRRAELEREVAAQPAAARAAARRRAGRSRRRRGAAHRVDPARAPRRGRGRARRRRRARRTARPGRLLGGHVGERPDDVARCAVRASSPAMRATPKSVSFATPAPCAGASGTRTLAGLTSRCTTPRRCAWASASQSATPDAQHVAVRERAARARARPGTALDELGDEVDRLVVARGLVQGDDPGCDSRAAARASRSARAGRGRVGADDPLHRDLAVELLVVGGVDHAEAARPEAAREAVAARGRAPGPPGRRGLLAEGPHRLRRSPPDGPSLRVHARFAGGGGRARSAGRATCRTAAQSAPGASY